MRITDREKLRRGLILGGICGLVAFIILAIFRENRDLGALLAAVVIIPLYFFLGRFLQLERARIPLVEDDKEMRSLLTLVLRKAKYEVAGCPDGIAWSDFVTSSLKWKLT